MKKRSQIRKYTVNKIDQLKSSETDADTLKLYTEHVAQKNRKLLDKQTKLSEELDSIRSHSEKLVFQMVDGIKDRLEKREQIILDRSSRPTVQDVQAIADLFSYMENQTNVIKRNSGSIGQLAANVAQIHAAIQNPACDYNELDEMFSELQQQCAKQQVERDKFMRERDKNRRFYKTIKDTIAEYRIRWQRIEAQISQRQKQLDHLVSYFNVRQREDKAKVASQHKLSNSLEGEILTAQQMLNQSRETNWGLEARRVDVVDRKQV